MTAASALLTLHGVDAGPPEVDRPLICGIDLIVQPGERIAIIGPSGAGKTSLLRAITGQLPLRRGALRIDGCDPATLSGAAERRLRAQIGMVAQKHDLVDPLPVDRNVMAGALGRWSSWRALRFLLRPNAGERAQARAALAAVGLADKLTRTTATLSGGEQQRVAIARALVQAPALLLADEPVASLDETTARATLDLLASLSRARGMALICTLHQSDLATRFCDRLFEMKDGRLTERNPARPNASRAISTA